MKTQVSKGLPQFSHTLNDRTIICDQETISAPDGMYLFGAHVCSHDTDHEENGNVIIAIPVGVEPKHHFEGSTCEDNSWQRLYTWLKQNGGRVVAEFRYTYL